MLYRDGTTDLEYDLFRELEEAFTTQPVLVAMIDATWKSRSYRDIRNVGKIPLLFSLLTRYPEILQAPEPLVLMTSNTLC